MNRLAAVSVCGGMLLSGSAIAATMPVPARDHAAGVAKADKVSIASKWVVGATTDYRFQVETQLTRTMLSDEGGTFSQIYRQEGKLTRRVVAAEPDGGATLSITITALKLQVSSGRTVLWYESAFKDDPTRTNDLTDPVLTSVNRPITVKVDAKGAVKSIEGNQDPEPTNEEEAKKPRVAQAVLGDAVIQRVWRPLYGVSNAPESVSVGDTWTFDDRIVDGKIGIFDLTQTFQITGVNAADAKVDVKADVKFKPAVGPGSIRPEMKEHDVRAVYLWDHVAGNLKTMDSSQMTLLEGEANSKRQSVKSVVTSRFVREDVAVVEDEVRKVKEQAEAEKLKAEAKKINAIPGKRD